MSEQQKVLSGVGGNGEQQSGQQVDRVPGRWNIGFNKAADKLRPLAETHSSRDPNYVAGFASDVVGVMRAIVTQPVWGIAELGARITGGRIRKVEAATAQPPSSKK